jgi:hypothetical protein
MPLSKLLLTSAVCLSLAACTNRFRAASPVNKIPGSTHVARASVQGFTADVEIGSWNGDPANLEEVVTPVKVKMSNEGNHAVSLRYRDFALSNPSGIRSSALPPFKIQGTVDVPAPIAPAFGYRNFALYPYYRFYGPAIPFWHDAWGWDAGWYNSYYGYWQRDLPTEDMLRKAIPEGVLNPGGSVNGYLYFQRVPKDAPAVQLEATLVDANTHQGFGTIRIPFEREGK